MADLTIGRLAAATGVKVETIRYYERAGLIAPAVDCAVGERVPAVITTAGRLELVA